MDSNFQTRLASAIISNGLTQEALAAKVGVTHSAVSRWLAGSMPRRARLVKVAEALGVSVRWLEAGDTSHDVPLATSHPEQVAEPDWESIFFRVMDQAEPAWLLERIEELLAQAKHGDKVAEQAVQPMLDRLRQRLTPDNPA